MSIGNLPQSLSQAMLVGTLLVGGLGVVLRHVVKPSEIHNVMLVRVIGCTSKEF